MEIERSNLEKRFPDFMSFAEKSKLSEFLHFFKTHKIELRTFKGKEEIWLLLEGEMRPWSEVKQVIFGTNNPSQLPLPHGWKYNQNGFVKKDMVKWKKLEPDWIHANKAKMVGNYYIELISKESHVSGFDRHCWIRLIDDQSGVISIGFCGRLLKFLPLRGQKGMYMSPDPGEFDLTGVKHLTRIKIKKADYKKLKDKIEADQESQNLYFNFMTYNCSAYVCGLLSLIGIRIDNAEFPTDALGRRIITSLKIKIHSFLKRIFRYIAMISRFVLSPFYNLLVVLCGGLYINKDIQLIEKHHDRGADLRPRPFSSCLSVFDCSNFKFRTGWKITAWQKNIEKTFEHYQNADGSFNKKMLR